MISDHKQMLLRLWLLCCLLSQPRHHTGVVAHLGSCSPTTQCVILLTTGGSLELRGQMCARSPNKRGTVCPVTLQEAKPGFTALCHGLSCIAWVWERIPVPFMYPILRKHGSLDHYAFTTPLRHTPAVPRFGLANLTHWAVPAPRDAGWLLWKWRGGGSALFTFGA